MTTIGLSRSGAGVTLIVLACAASTLALDPSVRGEQGTGVIQGTVTVASPPGPATLKVTADQPVCGDSVPDETVVAAASGGLANAVVILGGVEWPANGPPHVVANTGCLFVPRVQAARLRSTLEISSDDETLHTTHAYDDRNRSLFNVAIPAPGITITRPLRRPGVVRLECDSHSWMRGYVVVTDEMAVTTGVDGRFTLEGVPAGTYELRVWHEKLNGLPQTVTISPGATTEVSFVLE